MDSWTRAKDRIARLKASYGSSVPPLLMERLSMLNLPDITKVGIFSASCSAIKECNITRLLACQLEHPLVVNLGDFTARRVRASASVADKYASGIGRNENNPALSRAEKFKFMYTTEPRTATRPPLSSYT